MSVPEPASALKSSPSRKPWSFSEVESLPQNEIPWNQQSDEADVETPTELPHPQWPLAAARNVDTDTQDGSSVIVNGTRRRSSAARVTSNDSLPPAAKYRCLRCKQYKVGVRFVMTREHRGMPQVSCLVQSTAVDNFLFRQAVVPVMRGYSVPKARKGHVARLSSPPLEMLDPSRCPTAEYGDFGCCPACHR